MAYINKSHRTGTLEQVIGRHENGTILQGEADMFTRIQEDCEKSALHWYVWYDLSLPIAYAKQLEIQIDFLLICEKGAIILEVKGGRIQVINGRYYYARQNGNLTPMSDSPFEQANRYKWALLNHNVLNGDQLFVDYAVAFPHQEMNVTNHNAAINQSDKLWNKELHSSADNSFADFCEAILDDAREKNVKKIEILSEQELLRIVDVLSPTLVDRSHYAYSTLAEVLSWLQIDNIDILEGLSRNKRLLIEGGPGTGKTTMAKAYIKKHSGLRGLYLCQNVLLQARVREDLVQEDLYNCEVDTFCRFVNRLTKGSNNLRELSEIGTNANFKIYDYIIIDEAQDIAGSGVLELIDYLGATNGKGLSVGTYLLFYDIEQGYNSNSRNVEELADGLMSHATHYKLNENKRVITNKKLVEIANSILDINDDQEYANFISNLCLKGQPYLHVTQFDDRKTFSRALKNALKESTDKMNTVVLAHSLFKYRKFENEIDSSIYEIISDKSGIHILDENDIANPDKSSIPLTTILKYKGLETNKVILIIPSHIGTSDIRNFLFEVYVGFTRAMMELQILIF